MYLIVVALFLIVNQINAFVHPGVLVSPTQLAFIKAQVAAKVEPMYGAYLKAVASPYAARDYRPKGPPSGGVIDCGSYSHPDIGCSDSDSDATAAVTQALLWSITGDTNYSSNAILILNNYSTHLKGYNNSNAPLQAAWDCQKWPLAAELLRHTNSGWATADSDRFATLLTQVHLPLIHNGSPSNGNWEISMIDAMFGIAVFTEDTTLFDHAATFWKQRIPAYFYYHTDGDKPIPAPRGHPSWYGQSTFDASVDGVAQETCRDFGHTQYGIAGTLHAAETAHIQGLTLYESEKDRLTATMEFHTKYLLGATVPQTVCGGTVTLKDMPTYEVGYNEYHNRLGVALPLTLKWIETKVRTLKDPVDAHMMVFETLTDGANAPTVIIG